MCVLCVGTVRRAVSTGPVSLIFKKVYAMPPPIIIVLTSNHCIIRRVETSKGVAIRNSRYCTTRGWDGKEQSHALASRPALVAKRTCVPFVWSTRSREDINTASLSLVKHVHDQLDFVADLYSRLSWQSCDFDLFP